MTFYLLNVLVVFSLFVWLVMANYLKEFEELKSRKPVWSYVYAVFSVAFWIMLLSTIWLTFRIF